ncbi:hypothetical protein [Streptomyces sp. DSM 40750]|uniref:hypothetical protein n=1 Tax=Streptomyces sp. DSM 40750 TaxID=2801030 RepID=UPI00214CAB6F|nr:hypothetical protein [Streptomyces sp. DSM 40750]UUU25361.1 hypothetical protein JIX55_36800 [Streptomyces sp. DSM 40750]
MRQVEGRVVQRAVAGLGCHDEWNIFVRLDKARAEHPAYGPGELIAACYGGRARSMAESELETCPGYEVKEKTA